MKKAIVTVIGKDTIGIIALVTQALAERGVNVLDISQTVLREYFTMVMLADISGCSVSFDSLSQELDAIGAPRGLVIRIQRYVYPALSVIPVIFDCILHKICDRKRDFYLIHFCGNRAETLKDKFHFLLIRNRLQTF